MAQKKMAGDKASYRVDLLLAVESIEQRIANVFGRRRQFIELIAPLPRQWCWWHIQIAGEIERHGPMEETSHSFYRDARFGLTAADPLERLVKRVRIREDVMGSFPVGMLVGRAKPSNS